MVTCIRVFLGLAVLVLGCSVGRADPPRSREFQFTYQATVTGLKPGQNARIWLPVPPSNGDQDAAIAKRDLPGEVKIGKESKYGNRILYFEAKADADGKIPFAVTYLVTRREVRADLKSTESDKSATDLFLKPDAKVPVGGKSLSLIKDKTLPKDPVAAARVLYDAVSRHMRYSKEGTGWGRGDADWACDSGYGNCSDFHSLFISLARAQKIPAKFEIGFPLPEKRGAGDIAGYHCWAKFKPEGHGWIPVDISEASKNPKMKEYYFGNLTEDRVAFSVGRDLVLTPKQDGPPLNFFVYPYVEVDGKVYPDEKITRRFGYEDVGTDKKPK
jgi:transglutaminase-like putative cysteine protease